MVQKAWRIIPRPLTEMVLNNHAHHHRIPQPLILDGPTGVAKTTLILESVHVTGYVDLAQSIKDHHPQRNSLFPWYSWSNCDPPNLSTLQNQLEQCLESMAEKGVKLGTITSRRIFTTMKKWQGLNTALRRILAVSGKAAGSALWSRAVFALSTRCNAEEIDGTLELKEQGRSLSVKEASYLREAIVALKLAKDVIKLQHVWRSKAIAHLNRTGGFSRSLAHSCTDWLCLLLELLSQAAELDHFQITMMNPAMDKAVKILQKFSADVRCERIPKDRLCFGAPWRHPPSDDNPTLSLEWAKLQLLDFVQSLINAEFGSITSLIGASRSLMIHLL